MRRYALIKTTQRDNGNVITRYLPDNYHIIYTDKTRIIIAGEDTRGWTMQDYVIPRLASGLIFANEISFEVALQIVGGK